MFNASKCTIFESNFKIKNIHFHTKIKLILNIFDMVVSVVGSAEKHVKQKLRKNLTDISAICKAILLIFNIISIKIFNQPTNKSV